MRNLWGLLRTYISSGVANLAGLCVGAGVVNGIWELVFKTGGSLLLDLLGDLRVDGVGDTLAFVVLHSAGDGLGDQVDDGGYCEVFENRSC